MTKQLEDELHSNSKKGTLKLFVVLALLTLLFTGAMWFNKAVYKVIPPEEMCIRMDGSVTGIDNKVEDHALWYFREDFLLSLQHGFWHKVHPFTKTNATSPIDRRGEMFYYFHRGFVTRFDAERLSMGLKRVKEFEMIEGCLVEEGYFPHFEELGGNISVGSRRPNTRLKGAEKIEESMKHLRDDVHSGFLLAANGTRVSLLNAEGIDILGNTVEALYLQLNPERYLRLGVHNEGHTVLGSLSENGTKGVIESKWTAMKDPLFYRWHRTIDNLFEIHKAMLPPYELNEGEFSLVWEGVRIKTFEVASEGLSRTNVMETLMGSQKVKVPYTLDGDIVAENRTIEYCIRRLENKSFTFKIIAVRGETADPVNATVRVFMAPKLNETGGRLSLEDQRRMFFPLDQFKVTLNSGETEIIRSSTNSSLTSPWTFEDSTMQPPTKEQPHCGCGWPQHLLIPRGSTEGMPFHLFVILTNAVIDNIPEEYETNEDVCISPRILCGVRGQKFPDRRPMGYPFDRRPFKVPSDNGTTSGVPDSVEEYVQHIPNSKVIQVTVTHKD